MKFKPGDVVKPNDGTLGVEAQQHVYLVLDVKWDSGFCTDMLTVLMPSGRTGTVASWWMERA